MIHSSKLLLSGPLVQTRAVPSLERRGIKLHLFPLLFTQHHRTHQSLWVKDRLVSNEPVSSWDQLTLFETQNWEWSISSNQEAGLVGKSGYPVLLPVDKSEVGPPAIALRA